MKKILTGLIVVLLLSAYAAPQWGFFGHRRINKMAVFTLPPEMMVFFKKHIEYLSEHAVDPDKRRYATKHEAVRHYIDIDHWGSFPFDNVPRRWSSCLVKFTEVLLITEASDTIELGINRLFDQPDAALTELKNLPLKTLDPLRLDSLKRSYTSLFIRQVLPQYYEDEWWVAADSLQTLAKWIELPSFQKAIFKDRFSSYGILPYHLIFMQKQLTNAFSRGEVERLLRLLSDFGHYVADAHVPLHTTENYNGQMTDQVGIHAFWESRIPELFADKEYDYFVGKAEYIDRPEKFIWDIVLSSHAMLDSVLLIEKEMSVTFPRDQQYCFEERLDRTVKTQCKAYAAEYARRMNGMVERRMCASIHSLGSLWYTAWVDAGQPDLKKLLGNNESLVDEKTQQELDRQFERGESKGRSHQQ